MPRQSSALIAFHGNVTTTIRERKIFLGYPAVSRIWHFAFAFALLKFLDPLLPVLHPLLFACLNTPVRHQKSWYFPFCIISLACPFWWPPAESLSRSLSRLHARSLSLSIYFSLSPFLLSPYSSFFRTPSASFQLETEKRKKFFMRLRLFSNSLAFPPATPHFVLCQLPLLPPLRRQSLAFSMVL